MRRSIDKLDSLKHLLDGLGASDSSNDGKSISWVHSPACERNVGNSCPQRNQFFSCTCDYGKLTPLLLKTFEETMMNKTEGDTHEEFRVRLTNQASASRVATFFWISIKHGARRFQKR